MGERQVSTGDPHSYLSDGVRREPGGRCETAEGGLRQADLQLTVVQSNF